MTEAPIVAALRSAFVEQGLTSTEAAGLLERVVSRFAPHRLERMFAKDPDLPGWGTKRPAGGL